MQMSHGKLVKHENISALCHCQFLGYETVLHNVIVGQPRFQKCIRLGTSSGEPVIIATQSLIKQKRRKEYCFLPLGHYA